MCSDASLGLVALAVGLALGCGETTRPEATTRDAGEDAAVDGGDVGEHDGGSLDPLEWAPFYESPEDGCTIERATNPEQLPRLEWVACDAMPGCLQVVRDENWAMTIPEGSGWSDGEEAYFVMIRGERDLPSREQRQQILFHRLSGPAPILFLRQNAFAQGRLCQVLPARVVSGFLVLGVLVGSGPDGARLQPTFRVSLQTNSIERLGDVPGRGLNVFREAASGTETFVWWRDLGQVFHFDESGAEVMLSEPSQVALAPLAVGPWAYWVELEPDRSFGRLRRWRSPGPVETLDPFDGAYVLDFWSEGDVAAWVTSVDRTTGTFDLWTGRYAEDPVAWSPEHFARTRLSRGHGKGENTYVLVRPGQPSVLSAYHLVRRTLRTIVLSEKLTLYDAGTPVYVNDEEVMLSGRVEGVGWTTWRIDLTAFPEEPIPADERL